MAALPVPATYACLETSAFELVAHVAVLRPVEARLLQHGSLYRWASHEPQERTLRGRAPVYVARVPEASATLVVRHAWHGGLLRRITRDRFLLPTRAPLELHHALRLRALGISTPELLCYVRYPAGPGMRRVDVATRLIPDARDLASLLADASTEYSLHDSIDAVAFLLRQLAQHQVTHPDLNARNILLTTNVTTNSHAAVTAHMIDVDTVHFGGTPGAATSMRANASRLLRSLFRFRERSTTTDVRRRFDAAMHAISTVADELRAPPHILPTSGA